MGHSAPLAAVEATPEVVRKYMVGDNHCTELVVDMSKNSSYCQADAWWTDNKWHYASWTDGHCPAPYTKLDRTDHPIAVRCVDVDTYGKGSLEALDQQQPDHTAYWKRVAGVKEEQAETMIIHNVAPGGAHCTEIYWAGGKDNACWKNHGYQYPPNLWPSGRCDRTKFNWFNRDGTICDGASSKTWGIHT